MDEDTKKRLLTLHDDAIQSMELKRAAAPSQLEQRYTTASTATSRGVDSSSNALGTGGIGKESAGDANSRTAVSRAAKASRRAPVIAPISQQEVDSLTKNVIGQYSSYEIERIIQLQRYYDAYSYEPKISDGGRLPDDGSDPLYQIQSNMTTIARILSTQLEEDKYWEDVKKESKEEEEREKTAKSGSGGKGGPDDGGQHGSSRGNSPRGHQGAKKGYVYPEEDEEADEFIDDEELFSEGAIGGQRLRARVAKLRDQIYNSSILLGEKDIMFQIFRFAKIFQTPNILATPLNALLGMLEPHTRCYEKEDPNPYVEAYGRPSLQIRLLTALLRFRRDETNALKRIVKNLMEKLTMTEKELRDVAENAAREGASEISRLKAQLELMERERKFLYYRIYGAEGVEYFSQQLSDGTFTQTASATAEATLLASKAALTEGSFSGMASLNATQTISSLQQQLASTTTTMSPLGATTGAGSSSPGASPLTTGGGLTGAMAKAGGLKALAASPEKAMTKEQAAIHKQNRYRKEIDECYAVMRDSEVSRAVARVKGAKGQPEFYISKLEAHLDQQREMTTEATLFALKAADSRARAVEKLRHMEQRMMEFHDTMPLGRVAPIKQSLRRAEKDALKIFAEVGPGKYESYSTIRELPGFITGSFAGSAPAKLALSPKVSRYAKSSQQSSLTAEIPTIPILNHIGKSNVRIVDVAEAIVKEAVPYLESQVKSIIHKIESNSKGGAGGANGGDAGSTLAKRMADVRRKSVVNKDANDDEENGAEYTPNPSYRHEKTVALLRHVTGAADVVRQSLCTMTAMVLTAAASNGSSAGLRMKGTGHYSQEGGPPTPHPPESTIRVLAELEAQEGGDPPGALEGAGSLEDMSGHEPASLAADEHGNLLKSDGTLVDPEKQRHAQVVATVTARRALVDAVGQSATFRGAAAALRAAKANNKALSSKKRGGAAAARERELKALMNQYDPNDPMSLPPKNPAIGPTDLVGDNVYFVAAAAQLLHHDGFLQEIIDKLLVSYMRAAEADQFMDPYGLLTTGYRLDSEAKVKAQRRSSLSEESLVPIASASHTSFPQVGGSPTKRLSTSLRGSKGPRGSSNEKPLETSLIREENGEKGPLEKPETAEIGIQAVLVTTEELNAELNSAIKLRGEGGDDEEGQSRDSSYDLARGDADDGEIDEEEHDDDVFGGSFSGNEEGNRPQSTSSRVGGVGGNRLSTVSMGSKQTVVSHDFESAHSTDEEEDEEDLDEEEEEEAEEDYNEDDDIGGGEDDGGEHDSHVHKYANGIGRVGGASPLSSSDNVTRPGSNGKPPKPSSGGKGAGRNTTQRTTATRTNTNTVGGDSTTTTTVLKGPSRVGGKKSSVASSGYGTRNKNQTATELGASGRMRDPISGALLPQQKGGSGEGPYSLVGLTVSVGTNTNPPKTRNAYCQVSFAPAIATPSDGAVSPLFNGGGRGSIVASSDLQLGASSSNNNNNYSIINSSSSSPAASGGAASTARRLAALSADVDAAILALSRYAQRSQAQHGKITATSSNTNISDASSPICIDLNTNRRGEEGFSSQSPSIATLQLAMNNKDDNILLPSSRGFSAEGLVKSPRLCPVAVPTNMFDVAPLPISAYKRSASVQASTSSSEEASGLPLVDLTMVIKVFDFGSLLTSCPMELAEAMEMLRHLVNDEVKKLNGDIWFLCQNNNKSAHPTKGTAAAFASNVASVVRCETDCITIYLSHPLAVALLVTLAMRIERKSAALPFSDLLLIHPSAAVATAAEATTADPHALRMLSARRDAQEVQRAGIVEVLEPTASAPCASLSAPPPPASFYVCRGPRLGFSIAASLSSSSSASPPLTASAPAGAELAAVEAIQLHLNDPMSPPPSFFTKKADGTEKEEDASSSTAPQKTSDPQANASIVLDAAALRSLISSAAQNTQVQPTHSLASTIQRTCVQLLRNEYGEAALLASDQIGVCAFAAAYPKHEISLSLATNAASTVAAATKRNNKNKAAVGEKVSVDGGLNASHYFLETPASVLRARYYAVLELKKEGYTFSTIAEETSEAKVFNSYAELIQIHEKRQKKSNKKDAKKNQERIRGAGDSTVSPPRSPRSPRGGIGGVNSSPFSDSLLGASTNTRRGAADGSDTMNFMIEDEETNDTSGSLVVAELPSPFSDPNFKSMLLQSGPASMLVAHHAQAQAKANDPALFSTSAGSDNNPYAQFASSISTLKWHQDAIKSPSVELCGKAMAFVAIEIKSLTHYMSFNQFVEARRALSPHTASSSKPAVRGGSANKTSANRPSSTDSGVNKKVAATAASNGPEINSKDGLPMSDEHAYDELLMEAASVRAQLISIIDQTAAAMSKSTSEPTGIMRVNNASSYPPSSFGADTSRGPEDSNGRSSSAPEGSACYRCINWSATHRRIADYLEDNKSCNVMHAALRKALYDGGGSKGATIKKERKRDSDPLATSMSSAIGSKSQNKRASSVGNSLRSGTPLSGANGDGSGRIGGRGGGSSALPPLGGNGGSRPPTSGGQGAGRPPSSSASIGKRAHSADERRSADQSRENRPNSPSDSSSAPKLLARHRPYRHCPPTILVYACPNADSAVALAAAAHLNALHMSLPPAVADYFPALGPQYDKKATTAASPYNSSLYYGSLDQNDKTKSGDNGDMIWKGLPVRAVVGMATPSFAVVSDDHEGDGLLVAHDESTIFRRGGRGKSRGEYTYSDSDDEEGEEEYDQDQHETGTDADGTKREPAKKGEDNVTIATTQQSGSAEEEKKNESVGTDTSTTKKKKRRFNPYLYAAPMPTIEVFGEEVAMALSGLSAARFGETIITESAKTAANAQRRRAPATVAAAAEVQRPTAKTMASYTSASAFEVIEDDGIEGGGPSGQILSPSSTAAPMPNTESSPPFIETCLLIAIPSQPLVSQQQQQSKQKGGGGGSSSHTPFDFRAHDPNQGLYICLPKALQGRYNFFSKMAASPLSAKKALAVPSPMPMMGLPLLIRSWDRSVPMLQYEGEDRANNSAGGASTNMQTITTTTSTSSSSTGAGNYASSTSKASRTVDFTSALTNTIGIPTGYHVADLSLAAAFRNPLEIAEALSLAERQAASVLHRDYQRLLGVTEVPIDNGTIELMCSHDDDGLLDHLGRSSGGAGTSSSKKEKRRKSKSKVEKDRSSSDEDHASDDDEEDKGGSGSFENQEEDDEIRKMVRRAKRALARRMQKEQERQNRQPPQLTAIVGEPQALSLMQSLDYGCGLVLESTSLAMTANATGVTQPSSATAATALLSNQTTGNNYANNALTSAPARAAALARKYHPSIIPSLKLLTHYNSIANFIHRQAALSPAIELNTRKRKNDCSSAVGQSSSSGESDHNAAIAVIELHHWTALIRSLLMPHLPPPTKTASATTTAIITDERSSEENKKSEATSCAADNTTTSPLTLFQIRQNEEKAACIVAAASAITTSLRHLIHRHLDMFEGVEVSASQHFAAIASFSPTGVGNGNLESANSRGIALFPYWSPAHCPTVKMDESGKDKMDKKEGEENRAGGLQQGREEDSTNAKSISSSGSRSELGDVAEEVAKALHSTAHVTVAFADPIKAALCIAHLQTALEDFSPTTKATSARDLLNASARSAATSGGVGGTTGTASGGRSANANSTSNNGGGLNNATTYSTSPAAQFASSPVMSDGASEDEHVMRAVNMIMIAYNGVGGGIDGKAAATSAGGRGLKVRCALHYGILRTRGAFAVSVRSALTAQLRKRQDEELRSCEQQVEQLSTGGAATRSGHQTNNTQQEAANKASMYLNAQRDLVNGSRAIFGHAERHAFIASQELWQEAQQFYGEGLEHTFELLLLGPRRFMGSDILIKSEEGRVEAGSPSLDELAFCGGETIASKEFMAAVGAHPAVCVSVPLASRDSEGNDVQPFSPSLTIANEICQRLSRSVTAYTSTLCEFDKRGRTFNKIPFLPSSASAPTQAQGMEQASEQTPMPQPSVAAAGVPSVMSGHSQPPAAIVYLLPASLNYRVKTIGAFVREVMRADEDLKAQTIAELFGPSLTTTESPAKEKRRPASPSSSSTSTAFGYERLVTHTILDRRRREYTALLRALLQTGVQIPQQQLSTTYFEDLSVSRQNLGEIVNTHVQKSFPFASAFLRWSIADGERTNNEDEDNEDEDDEESDLNLYVRGRKAAEIFALLPVSPIAQSLNLKRLTRIIAKIGHAAPLEIIQRTMQVVGEAVSKNFTGPALRQHAAVVASGLATPTMSLAHATQLYQCWLDTFGVDIEHAVALQIDSEHQRGQAADIMLAAVERNSVEQLHQQNSFDDGRLLVPSSAAGGLTSNMPSLLHIGGAGASSLLRRPQHSFGRGSPLKTAETNFFRANRVSTISSSEPSSPNATATAKFLQQIVSAQQQPPTFSIGRRHTNNRGGMGGGGAHRNSAWGMSVGAGKLSSPMNRNGQLPSSFTGGMGGGAGAANGGGNPAMVGNSTRSVGASDLMLAVSLQQLFRHSCAVSAKAAKVMGYPTLSVAGNPNQFDSRLRDVISLVKSGGAASRGAQPAAPVDINTFHTSALDVVEHTKTVLQATMTALQCRTDRQSCFHRTTQTIIAIPPLDRSTEAESAVYKRVKDVAADGGEVFTVLGVRKDNNGDNNIDNNAADKQQTRNSVGTSPPRTAPSGAEGYDLCGGRDGTNRTNGNGGRSGEGGMPFSADAAKRVLSGAEAMQHAMRRGFRPGADQDITALRLRERRLMELEEELQRVASIQQEMLQQQQMLMNSSSVAAGSSTVAALLSRTAPSASSTSLTPAPHIALSLSVGGTAATAVSTPSAAVSEEAAAAIARSYFNALTVFNRPPPNAVSNTSLLPPIPRQSGAGGGGGALALRKGNTNGSLHAQQQFLNFSGHPTPSASRQGAVGGLPPISNNTSLLHTPPPPQQQQQGGATTRSVHGLLQPLALAMNNNDVSADDFTVDASFVTISKIDQTRDLRGDLASPFQSPTTTLVGAGAGGGSRGGVGFPLQSSRMGARRGLLTQTGGGDGSRGTAANNQVRSGGTFNASHLKSSPRPLGGAVKQIRATHSPLSPQVKSDGYETVDLSNPPTDEADFFSNGFDDREEESRGNEEDKGGVGVGNHKSRPTHAGNKGDANNNNGGGTTAGAKSVLTGGTILRRKPPSSSSSSTRPLKLNKPQLNQGTEDPSIE